MAIIDPETLTENVTGLFAAHGVDQDKAREMTEVLVEADLIGHRTHGVAQVPNYLGALERGEMVGSGDYRVVRDLGACITWDGEKLPGGWLVKRALATACDRVADHGVVTLVIGRAHHIGALAAYLREVTERGYVVQISSSTASAARMAPFGGTTPVLTPNPVALGVPTTGDPVMIDISATITTTTMTNDLARAGQRYPEPWALTKDGRATDDPLEVTERGGTLLPLGGQLKGYKGYGMALGIDLMTQGLTGIGKADAHDPMTLAVFIQVIDPDAFSGREEFIRQASFTADACRTSPPVPGVSDVRVPGDAAARNRRRALAEGLEVPDALLGVLQEYAAASGVVWKTAAQIGDHGRLAVGSSG